MENANRETQVGKQQFRTYKSSNTNKQNTKREMLIGRNTHLTNTHQKIQFGKYYSEIQIGNTNRKIKVREIQLEKYKSGIQI